ncbi:MAG: hypothetical protein WC291_10385 [Thermodesulfovibrionales bacterium]|jgi:hypothetical protein
MADTGFRPARENPATLWGDAAEMARQTGGYVGLTDPEKVGDWVQSGYGSIPLQMNESQANVGRIRGMNGMQMNPPEDFISVNPVYPRQEQVGTLLHEVIHRLRQRLGKNPLGPDSTGFFRSGIMPRGEGRAAYQHYQSNNWEGDEELVPWLMTEPNRLSPYNREKFWETINTYLSNLSPSRKFFTQQYK